MGIILTTTGLPLLSIGGNAIAGTAFTEDVPFPEPKPKPDPQPDLEPHPGPVEFDLNGPTTEITYRGVTFTFSEPVYWLESATGDPVVISGEEYLPNGTSITSISPESVMNATGYMLHGAVKNPNHQPDGPGTTPQQGFDGRMEVTPSGAIKTAYRQTMNIDPANTSRPIEIRKGDAFTIVKAVSDTTLSNNSGTAVAAYVPLTVMESLPPRPGTWFRPSMSAAVKEWPRLPVEEMDFTGGPNSPLRNLPRLSWVATPSTYLQEIAAEATLTQPMWADTGESGRKQYLSGENGNPSSNYSEALGNHRGRYTASIFSDWSGNPGEQEARKELACILVQWGIDRDGAHQEGQGGGAGAGQYWGFHPFYYLAAFMLQDREMLERCQWHMSNGLNQTHWVIDQMIGFATSWDVGSTGGGRKRVSETYPREMLGVPEWTRGNWKPVVTSGGYELPSSLTSFRSSASGWDSVYRDTSYNVIIREVLPIYLLRNGPGGETGAGIVNRGLPVGPGNIASAPLPYIDRSITFTPIAGRIGHKSPEQEMYALWRDEVPQPRWKGQPDAISHADLPIFSAGKSGEIIVDLSAFNFSTKEIKRREISYSQDGIQFSSPVAVRDVQAISGLRPGTDHWFRWRQINVDDEPSAWSPSWVQNLPSGKADDKYKVDREKRKTNGTPSGPISNIAPPQLMWMPYHPHPMPYFEPVAELSNVGTIFCGMGLWEGGSGDLVPVFQWQRHDGGGWQDIGGATEASYDLHPDDVGARVRCRVSVNGSALLESDDVAVPERPVFPANVVIDTPFDATFPLYWPDIYENVTTENADKVFALGVSWLDLDVAPGGLATQKTSARPQISIPLGNLPAGVFRIVTTVLAGLEPNGTVSTSSSGSWRGPGSLSVAGEAGSKTLREFPALGAQEYVAYPVDETWNHSGGPAYLQGRIGTSIGRTSGGNFIFADRLLITREDGDVR